MQAYLPAHHHHFNGWGRWAGSSMLFKLRHRVERAVCSTASPCNAYTALGAQSAGRSVRWTVGTGTTRVDTIKMAGRHPDTSVNCVILNPDLPSRADPTRRCCSWDCVMDVGLREHDRAGGILLGGFDSLPMI
jgi:hypothetical protein